MTKIQEEPSTKLLPYKTSDTPFAAFLHYSGVKLATTKQDPNDYKREVLVFIDEPKIAELEKIWKLGGVQGDLKSYHRSLKIVNNHIKEARRGR